MISYTNVYKIKSKIGNPREINFICANNINEALTLANDKYSPVISIELIHENIYIKLGD